jgi:cytochrome c oxidase subunit 2
LSRNDAIGDASGEANLQLRACKCRTGAPLSALERPWGLLFGDAVERISRQAWPTLGEARERAAEARHQRRERGWSRRRGGVLAARDGPETGMAAGDERHGAPASTVPHTGSPDARKREARAMLGTNRSTAGLASLLALLGVAALAGPAAAGLGQPSPGEITFQEAATPIAEQIHWLHDYINVIIFAIVAFVLALLLWVMWRFSEKRNPVPSRNAHNTMIEVLWTVIPVFILVIIAVPSFRLLYAQYTYPPPDLTIKAVGHAWNWTHEYPDQKFSVDSVMLQDDEREAAIKGGMPASQVPRNLAVTNEIWVPVNKVVHVLVTSTDVIHAWRVPSFGSMQDAVPGRISATWFKATKEGIFFGQCSELCGKDHSFMPIAVRVVKDADFKEWADATKARNRAKVKELILRVAKEQEAQKVASK